MTQLSDQQKNEIASACIGSVLLWHGRIETQMRRIVVNFFAKKYEEFNALSKILDGKNSNLLIDIINLLIHFGDLKLVIEDLAVGDRLRELLVEYESNQKMRNTLAHSYVHYNGSKIECFSVKRIKRDQNGKHIGENIFYEIDYINSYIKKCEELNHWLNEIALKAFKIED